MDELIGNLLNYEQIRNQEMELSGKRKEKNLVLKVTRKEDFEEKNIALLTKRFQCMLRKD